MCGFAGLVDLRNMLNAEELSSTVHRMSDAVTHRGPDDHGVWADPRCGVALGHRRLSVIDTAITGHQPMVSNCGRYVLAYNGEIYNFRAIKDYLEREHPGIRWRGHSDTEVLLEALIRLGTRPTLERAVGMFAFVLVDREAKELVLCRDRAGEKPLYYGFAGQSFLFGSELKALAEHPQWEGRIDRTGLSLYLKYGYIPAPFSIYEDIRKLEPGCYLEVGLDQLKQGRDSNLQRSAYWSIDGLINHQPFEKSLNEDEAVERLEHLLCSVISDQMIADVPLGAFLSGGIDSSTVVAIMQSMSPRPIRTFTIGFNEEAYDESSDARQVADYLGTDHTEFLVTEDESLAVIPTLPWVYDEPFSDSSQIPTILLSRITREHVTVSLSGDGGDELFSGYNRYLLAKNIWDKFGSLNGVAKQILSRSIMKTPDPVLDQLFRHFSRQIFKYGREGSISHKLKRFSELLNSRDQADLYQRMISINQDPDTLLTERYRVGTVDLSDHYPDRENYIDCMAYFDQMTYLPDDILVKVDRAAMSVSLETRVPFLDHRVFDFAWQVPQSLKIRNGQGKWILRQVLARHLPEALINRPKRGLGVPLRSWLGGRLRDWAESLLDEDVLARGGVFRPEVIRAKWQGHLSGKAYCEGLLWNILMFQAWLERKSNAHTPADKVVAGGMS